MRISLSLDGLPSIKKTHSPTHHSVTSLILGASATGENLMSKNEIIMNL